MKFCQILLAAFVMLINLSFSLNACTTFVLKRDGKIILAKNFDWFIGDGFLIINNRGVTKSAFLLNDAQTVKWKSRYGSITFNQLGKEFPLGGMNEKGLVIEELNYSLSKYPPAKTANVNELQWIQYHLDNSQSVQEVLENLEEITISPLLFKLHYFLCDRSGEVAIIEFLEGEVKYYSGEEIIVPVLTNNSYENSLKYLRHHEGFGGSRTVSDGSESPERFVRAATLIRNYDSATNRSVISDAFAILNSVKQNDTQWSIVYDISGGEIQFTTLNTTNIRSVNLNDFSFENTEKISYLVTRDYNNSEQQFEVYSIEKNSQLLKTVFGKLSKEGEMSEESAEEFLNKLLDYSRQVKSDLFSQRLIFRRQDNRFIQFRNEHHSPNKEMDCR